jgi:glycosyltransferase involved in cell wall biosynthesis
MVIGPPPTMVGGMASVVEQILSLELGSRYRTEAFPGTFSTDEAESFGGRVVRHLRHLRLLSAAIRRTQPAIVHVHTCSGFSLYRSTADLMVAKRSGCRTVLHVHGAAFDEFCAGAGAFQRRLIARSLSKADRVVALSQSWQDKLLKTAPGARVVVVENAIVDPGDVPIQPHDGPCRFLLLARMDRWKGIDDLLDAAACMRAGECDLELVLAGPAGTAGDADILDGKIRTRGLTGAVRYVGSVQGEEKANLFHQADVYVQPSHHEGMPISLLEALSHGLPIIATEVGAVPEVITDRCEGLLVPPHNPALLAKPMRELAGDGPARRAMGLAARRLAATRFSMDRLRDDLISLYDDVLTEEKGDWLRAHGRSGHRDVPPARCLYPFST